MNNVNLEWLVNNFVSFHTDQDITGALSVSHAEAKVMVVEGNTKIDGYTQQIKIEEFFANVLRTKDQQYLMQNLKYDTVSLKGET